MISSVVASPARLPEVVIVRAGASDCDGGCGFSHSRLASARGESWSARLLPPPEPARTVIAGSSMNDGG